MFDFQDILEKTKIEAFQQGYKDALKNGDNSYSPKKYGNSLYISEYREGFKKGMEQKSNSI